MDEDLPQNRSETPLIAGDFNNWKYEPMQEVVKFCMDNDYLQPDFVKKCMKEDKIWSKNVEDLKENEKRIVAQAKEVYYSENWKSVLMRIGRFKKPMVANAHKLTQQSLKVDPTCPVYIHFDWVKPGRRTYVVSHEPDEVFSDGEEGKADRNLMEIMFKVRKGNKKQKTDFFVHDMLVTPRDEKVPFYFKQRHVR